MIIPGFQDIEIAHERIHEVIHRTPVMTCRGIDAICGVNIFFKCENFQKVGAFKFRGASNAVLSMPMEEISGGVATHSSGNHAAALALAASQRGVPCYIVMPRTAPAIKKKAVEAYGGIITFCEPTLEARESTLKQVVEKTGAVVVHPYNNPLVIAGQGTAALELLRDVHELDAVIAPVGGGGLLSGTTICAKKLKPDIQVIGAEPAMADDAMRSLREGKIIPSVNPRTIADGLLTSLGSITFAVLSAYKTTILTASEENIIRAMQLIWERMKIIAEPSSAVALAIILEHPRYFKKNFSKVGIILSGGNVDLMNLPFAPAKSA